ncbi:MAG: hypothetical protein ACYDAY_04395 [Candidatus Dormibacteria bacterium]
MTPDDNAPRTLGRAGTYEAWYLTFTEPGSGRGFWIRYTLLQPDPATGMAPECALWAFAFFADRPARNVALKQVLPIADFGYTESPMQIRVGAALLSAERATGTLVTDAGEARWDLSLLREAPCFPFVDRRMERLASTVHLAVSPALRVSGTVEMGGQAFTLDGAPGGQAHLFGRRHAREWNWAFASGLDGSGSWFDGVSAHIEGPLGRTLRGTTLGAHVGGHDFRANGFLETLRNAGSIAPVAFVARAHSRDMVLSARVTPRPVDLVGVTYTDPSGERRVCYHTELADLELELTRRDEKLAATRLEGACAFEYASPDPVPGWPVML